MFFFGIKSDCFPNVVFEVKKVLTFEADFPELGGRTEGTLKEDCAERFPRRSGLYGELWVLIFI